MDIRLLAAAVLASCGLACGGGGSLPGEATPPSGDDDTTPAPDDDAADDDSTAAPDDDDVADDDVVDDDAADDDTGDDDTPVPTTFLNILEPSGAVALLQPIVLQADGEEPGRARLYLDGAPLSFVTIDPGSGQGQWTMDTGQHPDGSYTLRAELLDHPLFDEQTVVFANGDLLRYPLGAVVLDGDNLPHLTQEIPPDVWSISSLVTVPDGPSYEWLGCYVLDPQNTWAVTDTYMIPGSGASPYAGTIPNHPHATLLSGDYDFYPAGDAVLDGVEAAVEVQVKRGSGVPMAGVLDLDLHFAPGTGLTALAASTDPRVLDLVDAIEAIYLQVGLAIGDVRTFDAVGPDFDTITGYGELWDLFGSPPTNADRTLSLFFVQDLQIAQVIGIASHIPGPAFGNGTRQGGVAVEAASLLSGDTADMAAVAAHEIGHFLGLFHPTEIGGALSDPLQDTAASCDASTCWATNLMDPYAYGTTTLTAGQGSVVLRHPLVQNVDPTTLPAARSLPFIAPRTDAPRICAGRGAGWPE